jgi:amino acid adenylation domain-containing protein
MAIPNPRGRRTGRPAAARAMPLECPLPPLGRLDDLFRAQAERSPDAVALRGNETVTYAALRETVDGVAARLAVAGIGRGARVGLWLERSSAAITGMLGILRAGAVCVPLDADTPPARATALLEDAGAEAVVTADGFGPAINLGSIRALDLSADGELAGKADTGALAVAGANLDDRAFVFFTSGSTGRPKGVVQTHRQCCYGQLGPMGFFEICPSDRVLLHSPISTSGFVCEALWALLVGASTVVADQQAAADPQRLVSLIARHGVTVVLLVPALLRALLDEPGLAQCRSLRIVCSAGEGLPPDLQATALGVLPGRLAVIYGTTETPSTTARFVTPGAGRAALDIGRPLPTKSVVVLNASRRPAALGAVGELCVGGDGIAEGYWQRPDLTAERFFAAPAAAEVGGSLFHTGDLVRVLGDGSLEFLGRADDQIKINGMRVEPVEIESALRATGAVRDAVVAAWTDGSAARRLVAYVVVERGRAPSSPWLRARLRPVLPSYMVPTAFVRLAQLPRTRNGKVDRAALPPPSPGRRRRRSKASMTDIEELLARLWCDALDVDEVGRRDDFIALGGHSLSAAVIANRLRSLLGVEASMRAFFDHPTLAALAAALGAAGATPAAARAALASLEPASALPRTESA